MRPELRPLVEAGDLNELLRSVDGLCSARAWEDLVELADACEDAVERGKQLWPIAAHIDYRLALEAPADYAAAVLGPDTARFAHGPLTEVAASTHSWADLSPHIELPQTAGYVAHERVLRGEDLTGAADEVAEVLELPLRLQEWEPVYALPIFRADHVEVPEPWEPRSDLRTEDPRPGDLLDEPEIAEALLELVLPWTTESNGAARAVVVEGDAVAAASAIAYDALTVGELTMAEALQRMAWAAASGGARGRRRGGALGRFLAWYAASVLADTGWPVEAGSLHRSAGSLRWHLWDEGVEEHGWILRLAIEDPEHGWSAALAATDLLEEESLS